MQNRIIHRISLAILFMLALPLISHGQYLFFESYYWMKHASGEDDFYSIWQYGRSEVIGDKEYRHLEDSNKREYFCRTEDGKIIRYDVTDGKEYVLCDYNLKEGDMFQTKDGREMKVVMAGDTLMLTMLNEKYAYKCVKLENVNDPKDTDLWIKDMGSYNNILMFPEECDDIVERRFLWNDRGIVNVFNTENLKTQLMKVEREYDGDIVFNGTDYVIEYPTDSLNCEFVKDTLVVSGRVYSNCSVGHYLTCYIEGSHIIFMVQVIPPEALCNSSHYFTAKFPGFKPGEYTFEYVPLGLGTPSGKLEITGDLVCGGHTGFDTIKNGSIKPNAIYDLSGRQLNQAPERGIYIQGGKKVIK